MRLSSELGGDEESHPATGPCCGLGRTGAHDQPATSTLRNLRGSELAGGLRARSTADFMSKLGLVLEEADEALFWLELLVDAALCGEIKSS